MKRAPTGQEGAEREEGADRSGGHCIKRRVRTGEEGDVRSGGRQQVRRALYGEKGVDLSGGRRT